MNNKSIAVGLVFGVGLALALNSWLLELSSVIKLQTNQKTKS